MGRRLVTVVAPAMLAALILVVSGLEPSSSRDERAALPPEPGLALALPAADMSERLDIHFGDAA